jgi:hypothetical protein
MVRFATMIAAVGAVGLAAYGTAQAASDITLAAIAMGRLYVVGTTDRSHMPVVLDGQFRTESDAKGLFQYDLVYRPSRCIVTAVIAGKSYDAVVSNCGELCRPNLTGAAGTTFAQPPPAPGSRPASVNEPSGWPASPALGSPARSYGTAALTPPATAAPPTASAPPVPTPDATSAVDRDARRTGTRGSDAAPIINPPLPPARPTFRLETRARPVRHGDSEPARRTPRIQPPEPEALPED